MKSTNRPDDQRTRPVQVAQSTSALSRILTVVLLPGFFSSPMRPWSCIAQIRPSTCLQTACRRADSRPAATTSRNSWSQSSAFCTLPACSPRAQIVVALVSQSAQLQHRYPLSPWRSRSGTLSQSKPGRAETECFASLYLFVEHVTLGLREPQGHERALTIDTLPDKIMRRFLGAVVNRMTTEDPTIRHIVDYSSCNNPSE